MKKFKLLPQLFALCRFRGSALKSKVFTTQLLSGDLSKIVGSITLNFEWLTIDQSLDPF